MQLRIEIVTKIERAQALSLIHDAIGAHEGWVVNHQLFSNMAASLNFEMPVTEAPRFMRRLKDAGFNPKLPDGELSVKTGDIRGSIAITFLHSEPDLKRDVPAFG